MDDQGDGISVWSSWWHVTSAGVVDGWDAGEGGPESVPDTLAGWYAAIGLPDTATNGPIIDSGATRDAPSAALLVLAATAGPLENAGTTSATGCAPCLRQCRCA